MTLVFEKPTYRLKNLGVRVTPEELSNLHKLSNLMQLSMSEIIRTAVNEFATKRQVNQVF